MTIAEIPILEPSMAKKKPEPPDESAPMSGTLRLPADLIQMLQDIQHLARGPGGRRRRIGQIADELCRAAITRRHKEVMEQSKKKESE